MTDRLIGPCPPATLSPVLFPHQELLSDHHPSHTSLHTGDTAIQREHSCIFPPFFKVSLFLHQFSVVKGMSILQCAMVQPSTCAFDSMVSHYPNSALPAASLYHLYLKSHCLFSSLCLNLLHTHFRLRLYSINTRADFKLPNGLCTPYNTWFSFPHGISLSWSLLWYSISQQV